MVVLRFLAAQCLFDRIHNRSRDLPAFGPHRPHPNRYIGAKAGSCINCPADRHWQRELHAKICLFPNRIDPPWRNIKIESIFPGTLPEMFQGQLDKEIGRGRVRKVLIEQR